MGKQPVHGKAAPYLTDLCQSVSDLSSLQHLWSLSWSLLVLPCYQLGTYGHNHLEFTWLTTWLLAGIALDVL